MKSVFLEMRWTIFWTAVIGVFVSSSFTDFLTASYRQLYDDTHPVVAMTGKLISRAEGKVIIHVKGVKLRQCRFITLNAYAVKDGEYSDVYRDRINGVENGVTKQVGVYDLGQWALWPVVGAEKVVMRVTHDCGGRLLSAEIADVAL